MKRLQALSESSEGLVPDIGSFEEFATEANLPGIIDLADLSGVVPEFCFSPPQESNEELINYSEFCEYITSISTCASDDQESTTEERLTLASDVEYGNDQEGFRRNDSFASSSPYGSSSSYDSVVANNVEMIVHDTDIVGWINEAERALSDGDLVRTAVPSPGGSSPFCDELKQVVPSVDFEDSSEVGSIRYCREQRMLALQRFKAKREQRNFQRKIKYVCRKLLADCRPRVKGRFVKANDVSPTACSAVEERIDYNDLLEAVQVKEERDIAEAVEIKEEFEA